MKNVSKKERLAIFDMDGTLFDTTEVNCLSYIEAARIAGYNIDGDDFKAIYTGKNYKEFLPELGITEPRVMERIHSLKKQLYTQFLYTTKKNFALFDLIQTIRAQYIIALATTASKKNTMDILRYFNVEHLFEIIITQENTTKLKPDPECYLLVMERAGIEAEHTIIFEDSEVGLLAAKRSGAYPIHVTIECIEHVGKLQRGR